MNFPPRAGRVSGRATTPTLRHAPRAKLQRTNPGSNPLSLRGILFKRSGPALSPRKGIAGIIEALVRGSAIKVGYDAEHESASLPVVASLTAPDEPALTIADPPREIVLKPDSRRRNHKRGVAAAADAAGFKTDVEPVQVKGGGTNTGAGASFLVGRSAACAATAPTAVRVAIATHLSQILIIRRLRVETRRPRLDAPRDRVRLSAFIGNARCPQFANRRLTAKKEPEESSLSSGPKPSRIRALSAQNL
jgi:hypothetical protein